MNDSLRVGQFMTSNIVVGSLQSKLSDIIFFFTKNRIRHLPITNNEALVGMVSTTDILELIQQKLESNECFTFDTLNNQINIEQIMSKNPVSVQPDTPISDALKIMQDEEIGALPVTENGNIAGIITRKDLVDIFSKELNPPHIAYTIESPGYGI